MVAIPFSIPEWTVAWPLWNRTRVLTNVLRILLVLKGSAAEGSFKVAVKQKRTWSVVTGVVKCGVGGL